MATATAWNHPPSEIGSDGSRYIGKGITGAPSPGISLPVTEWEESHVASWLSTLNLTLLATSFREQGITGDVLVQLDNEALKDLGVSSVGQRLALLGGIYRLKVIWGLEIEEGDYHAQSEEIRATIEPPITNLQLDASLRQRDERIARLEQELRRATIFLAKFQHDFTGICRYQGLKAPTLDQSFRPFAAAAAAAETIGYDSATTGRDTLAPQDLRATGGSPRAKLSPAHAALHSPATSSAKGSTPTSLVSGADGIGGHMGWGKGSQPPSSARSPLFAVSDHTQNGDDRLRMPLSGGRVEPEPSPHHRYGLTHGSEGTVTHVADETARFASDGRKQVSPVVSSVTKGAMSTPLSASFPSSTRSDRGPDSSLNATASNKLSENAPYGQMLSSPSIPNLSSQVLAQRPAALASPTSRPRSNSAAASPTTPSSLQSTGIGKSSARDATTPSSASSAAGRDLLGTTTTLGTVDNPYKSFRVTLEDPCYKVLPAALKKYKINDDWRHYALFICYGSTERCLSYDEKPLLLFQKLKEARQQPVFMLRHIRDVKSPIAIANAKAAARRESGSTSSTPGSRRLPEAGNGGSAVARREVILQNRQGADGGESLQSLRGEAILTGPAAQLENLDGPKTFAIAIYPYSCEREDEFDVNVGDTFVVLSKAKGWWIVQRDSNATGLGDIAAGSSPQDGSREDGRSGGAEIRSGWVPAGCLIETSRPLAAVVPTDWAEGGATNASSEAQDYLVEIASRPTGEGDDAITPTPASIKGAHSGNTDSARSGPMSRLQREGPAISPSGRLGGWDKASIPIPPSVITSTSTPGIMLMEYSSIAAAASSSGAPTSAAISETAGVPDVTGGTSADGAPLQLQKDDRLRVFKRYNHWSYCVQENGKHARGWVPSWYIGKISPRSAASSSGATVGEAAGTAANAGALSPAPPGQGGSLQMATGGPHDFGS